MKPMHPIDILLVEDNPGDARLAQEAFKVSGLPNTLHHVVDGVEGWKFLNREGEYANAPRPDLVLLDLNMPRMDGRELLKLIKSSKAFRAIPVVVLTVSSDDQDIEQAYELYANCFITKPLALDDFTQAIRTIESFWLTLVRLPPSYL